MHPELILIGGGGHCKACIDVIRMHGKYRIAGIVDQKEKRHERITGYEIIASDDTLPELARQYANFLITIGQIKEVRKRIEIFSKLKKLGVKLPTIISPLAYVSQDAIIHEGTIVMHHAIVNAGAVLGENCIVNTRALIEHDAVISAHCHISTGAVINGGSRIGVGTFIGSLTMVRENLDIGKYCIIGAGQAVFQNIEDNILYRK